MLLVRRMQAREGGNVSDDGDTARMLRARMIRFGPDGKVTVEARLRFPKANVERLRSPEDQTLDRLMRRANEEFGDPTKDIGGPELPRVDEPRRKK